MTPFADFLTTRRGFNFVAGSACDCEDKYRANRNDVYIAVQYSSCKRYGKDRTCPVEWVAYINGEVRHVIADKDLTSEAEVDAWLQLTGFIMEGETVSISERLKGKYEL